LLLLLLIAGCCFSDAPISFGLRCRQGEEESHRKAEGSVCVRGGLIDPNREEIDEERLRSVCRAHSKRQMRVVIVDVEECFDT